MSENLYVALGEVCDKASSHIAKKELSGNSGKYPIYGADGFIKNVDFYNQENEYIAVVKDGAGVGRAMVLPARSSVIGTMQYILPKPEINVRYLFYAIEHMNLSKYANGAAIPHIYFKDYKKEKLIFKSLENQEKVVKILDKVVNLIALHKQQLNRFDNLVKSRFCET